MLNLCQFIGHLGADPECRITKNDKPVVSLSLAVTEKWKSKEGERKESTEWIRCTIFSEGLCGVAEKYLKKGSKIYISGKWKTNKWQDQEGKDRYSTELILQGFDAKLVMLDSRNDGDSQQSNQSSGSNKYEQQSGGSVGHGGHDDPEDSIPFFMEWRV